jgi:hypothetical protein
MMMMMMFDDKDDDDDDHDEDDEKEEDDPLMAEIPFGPSELGQLLEVVPVMELRYLQLFWLLPPIRPHYGKGAERSGTT